MRELYPPIPADELAAYALNYARPSASEDFDAWSADYERAVKFSRWVIDRYDVTDWETDNPQRLVRADVDLRLAWNKFLEAEY